MYGRDSNCSSLVPEVTDRSTIAALQQFPLL